MFQVTTFARLAIIVSAAVAAPTIQFIQTTDGRCLNTTVSCLSTMPLTNERQCALACYANNNCGTYVADTNDNTCKLYYRIDMNYYQSLTYQSPNKCVIGIANKPVELQNTAAYIIFNSTTNWVVPNNIWAITGLCIGSGAGGGSLSATAAGGSGYIAYSTVPVIPGISIPITIGQGGAANTSGSSSSIGSYIVASGGVSSARNTGGAGGSAGGAGVNGWGNTGGAGGSGGSNGATASNSVGGTGQGTAAWLAAFSAINTIGLNVTAGLGGTVVTASSSIGPGGGGGGGILVNGFGPTAGSGSSSVAGGKGGVGYGAGGGGCGCASSQCTFNGGSGVVGVCIIKLF